MSRYIDADKLKAHYAWWGREDEEKKLFDSVVDVQPTADVVEVKHGNWIEASNKLRICKKCSICGERITYSECFNGDHLYCHKCGAKMDGKDGE